MRERLFEELDEGKATGKKKEKGMNWEGAKGGEELSFGHQTRSEGRWLLVLFAVQMIFL